MASPWAGGLGHETWQLPPLKTDQFGDRSLGIKRGINIRGVNQQGVAWHL